MAAFEQYLGIDYSGAQTPEDSLPGLRVYCAAGADLNREPVEVAPPASPRKYWTRRGLAQWLVSALRDGPPTLVGIDHGFSFPLAYFEEHRLPLNWPAFLDDFQHHWPTDAAHTYVDFVRDGTCGNGAARTGNPRWRRLTEIQARAKSVFHFDVQGSVAKSTHAGLPWLRYLRLELGARVHFWPFDGWQPPAGRSVIAEVYPRLWSRQYPRADRSPDQQDAYAVARWLQEADCSGALNAHLEPALSQNERRIAEIEGWILGVGAPLPSTGSGSGDKLR